MRAREDRGLFLRHSTERGRVHGRAHVHRGTACGFRKPEGVHLDAHLASREMLETTNRFGQRLKAMNSRERKPLEREEGELPVVCANVEDGLEAGSEGNGVVLDRR